MQGLIASDPRAIDLHLVLHPQTHNSTAAGLHPQPPCHRWPPPLHFSLFVTHTLSPIISYPKPHYNLLDNLVQTTEGSLSIREELTLEPAEGEVNTAGLAAEKHIQYILTVEKRKDDFVSVVMEHLRMSGAYWGLTTLNLLEKLDNVDVDEVVSWVMNCQHESGGFGGNIAHDPHILYTLSAVQVLVLFDKLNVLDIDKVTNYVAGLQNEDGSFSGDIWGEVDTRFSYIAICCLSILRRLNKINVEKAVSYIVSCKNLDGGFGCTPGGESHAGQIFCCVAALSLTGSLHHIDTGSLHHIDKDLLGWWLCERQVKSGGLNGRPEKLPDVCYSWWVLSSLIMIDRVHWINKEKLVKYILDCQDMENGGISDRPDDAVDVYHTCLGVAGLSLLEYPGLKAIDPAYALPVDVVNIIFFGR